MVYTTGNMSTLWVLVLKSRDDFALLVCILLYSGFSIKLGESLPNSNVH